MKIQNAFFKSDSPVRAGLHVVGGTTLTEVDGEQLASPFRISFDPIFFEIRTHVQQPANPERLTAWQLDIEKKRNEFINKIHKTNDACGDASLDKNFRITVFGVGCLVHGMQQLEGYRIEPIGAGLSHRRFLELLNTFLKKEKYSALPYLEETERQFQQSTPTLAVTYPRVQAKDHEDALEHCRAHSQKLFQILGMKRGQIPREFAYLAMEHNTTNRWHGFEMPGYRGNLLSDLNPSQLAQDIESQLPKLEANPFTRLLVRSYSEATAERDDGFRMLRYWTVLELAADRTIPKGQPIHHPGGLEILNPRGNPETTNSKHGRVYEYVLQGGGFASMGTTRDNGKKITYIIGDESDARYKQGMIVITLWEMIQAIYAVRCAVAHEGYFDPSKRSYRGEILASDYFARDYPDMMRFVASQAQMAIWRDG